MRAADNAAVSATQSEEESLDESGSEGEEEEKEDEAEEADAGVAAQDTDEPDAVGLPCGVKAVFAARCQGCHGVDAKNGTPLLTRDNLVAFSSKDPMRTVVERALLRATAIEKPMPPVGRGTPLTEAELTVIRDWVEHGTQPGRCDE